MIWITTKVLTVSFEAYVHLSTEFYENQLSSFPQSCLTNKQTNKQNVDEDIIFFVEVKYEGHFFEHGVYFWAIGFSVAITNTIWYDMICYDYETFNVCSETDSLLHGARQIN